MTWKPPTTGWRVWSGRSRAHPEVACIGGNIRPRWTTPRPSWLTDRHFGPIALQEWTEPSPSPGRPREICIATENLGCRRAVFEELGLFSGEFPRGSDREFQLRLWQGGKRGLYLPDIEVWVDVPASGSRAPTIAGGASRTRNTRR